MSNKCLYCYGTLDSQLDFHPDCGKEFFGVSEPPQLEYSYEEMNELAKKVVQKRISVPGVQPKISMSVIKKAKEEHRDRLTVIGALGGEYILKPPSPDYPEMPQNEHVTMQIAKAFGINVVPSSLIRLNSGELAYITRRIDRTAKLEKIHMLDMLQITESYDKYLGSMEKIGKAIGSYSVNPLLDKILLFELTLFSFVTGNNDMHLKNFSMIKGKLGWTLSPAYDLLNVPLVLPTDNEELALTIQGKKRKFKKEHFEKFGSDMGMTNTQIKRTFQRLFRNRPKIQPLLEKSFLSREMQKGYLEIVAERYARLE